MRSGTEFKSKMEMAMAILIEQYPNLDYAEVVRETGLAMSTILVLVSRMRRDGLLPKLVKKRYEYTATHIQTGAVAKFKSMYSADKAGFTSASLRNMFAKGRSEYCGYRWERKEVVSR